MSMFDDWQPGALAGVSNPAPQQIPAPTGNGNVAASDGSFYDAAKLAALQKTIAPGADGRTVLNNDAWMKLLNPISGLHQTEAAVAGGQNTNYGDGGGEGNAAVGLGPAYGATQAVFKDAQGRTYHNDGSGNLTYFDNNGQGWKNPTGSDHDYVQPTYKLNPDGSATPVNSGTNYSPSMWVSSGRLAAELLATVGTAGAAGAYFGGAGALGGATADAAGTTAAGTAAGGGTAGMSSADLAALHSAAGYGAETSAEAGFAGLGGTTAGGAAGSFATSAPAYGGVGTEGAGAAGEGATPWYSSAADSLSKVSAGQVLSGLKAVAPLLGGLSGSKNSGGASSGSPGALSTAAPADMGRASAYTYGGVNPNDGIVPASRPGHTMGPSIAVNRNDPSAAMFGYGAKPIYYSQTPQATTIPVTGHQMADGGSVDDNSDPFTNPQYDFNSQVEAPSDQASALLQPNPYDFSGKSTGPAAAPTDPNAGGGALGWLKRLSAGGKDEKGQAVLGGGALLLLAQMLHHNAVAPGYQTAGQLRAGLAGNRDMTPQQISAMGQYFNAPASHYTAPAAPGVVTVPRAAYAAGGSTGEVYDSRVHPAYLAGPTGGQADRVPANLGHGEYIMDADVVAALGDGNNANGAQKLDEMRENIRRHKRSAPPDSIPPEALSPLAYMRSR